MSSDLPEFRVKPIDKVRRFIDPILTNHISAGTHLVDLISYDDGHYRAVFDQQYFVLDEDQAEPSKSQWNTLKKKLKRNDPQVFVFKAHGTVEWEGKPHYYVDFGFFAH